MICLGIANPDRERRALTSSQFESLGALQPHTAAGVTVTQGTAMSIAAYWCGVNVLSGDIGVIDRIPYERVGDDDRKRLPYGHYLSKVMDVPNPYMTQIVFWQTLMAHALTWGNGYAEIEFDQAMRPIALWPITPDKMEPRVEIMRDGSSRLIYIYNNNFDKPLLPEDVIHVPGLGFDGIRGYSLLHMARTSLGVSMAMDRFAAAFYANGMTPGLILQHPGTLTAGAQERLRASLEARHAGPDRAHRLLILEEDMKLPPKPPMFSPTDAQFAETHDIGIEDMARWLNMPIHKLKHKAGERPGGNLEASEIEYHTGTLLPWATRIEQELNRKLIPQAQRGRVYVEHLFAKRLKADLKARTDAEKAWYDMGVLDAEQIARIENLPKPKPKTEENPPAPSAPPPTPGLKVPDAPAESKSDDIENTMLQIHDVELRDTLARRELYSHILAQYVRRESSRVKQAAKKDAAGFEGWAEEFFRREEGVLADALAPFVRYSLAGTGSEGDADGLAGVLAVGYLDESRESVLSLKAKDLEFHADRLAKKWETTRAAELADAVLALPEELKELRNAA